ncbi:lysine amidinotransferase [Hirsutella rhossiliensis]|uniref:Glycine amidinotransferase, mitochondrial n=1 Tax=Hirsutella rhossiliensis TaxID=111463 RepID=A0A9P8MTM8_9HYPO|nr:lysine amidinotransferase [Hirsutella rhossiliensis]KAH0960954.1 lysine amidinotransferase [Hirsutella rhossiliensis]
MPADYVAEFRPLNPFPANIVAKARWELDNFARLLQSHSVRVYRPKEINWSDIGGYTGAMPRDGLMTVGNTLIEAHFAWRCRRDEIKLGYSDILNQLRNGNGIGRIYRAPVIKGHDSIYDGVCDVSNGGSKHNNNSNGNEDDTKWAINNSRPAFDTADFLRFGKTIIGQLSHVTNLKGVQYLRAIVPEGYSVEILRTIDKHAMHIDATILPLREGVLVYNPERVTEEELRRHAIFACDTWELHPYPYAPQRRESHRPPMYMCSPWLVLNAFSLDERRIFVEENDIQFAHWVKCKFNMEPILCPFQHVNSLGGSFHCATVDLVRDM